MTEETKIFQVDQKFKIVFEQAASTKGIMGFKVEANGDSLDLVESDASNLLRYAKANAPNIATI